MFAAKNFTLQAKPDKMIPDLLNKMFFSRIKKCPATPPTEDTDADVPTCRKNILQ
jgi:hypothetical protein